MSVPFDTPYSCGAGFAPKHRYYHDKHRPFSQGDTYYFSDKWAGNSTRLSNILCGKLRTDKSLTFTCKEVRMVSKTKKVVKKIAAKKAVQKAAPKVVSTQKKWVYQFEEVKVAEKYTGSWDGVRGLLGGKGSGLADMTRAGVPDRLAISSMA